MNNFCIKGCPIGIEKSRELLDKNNSAYDAAMDMQFFVDKCIKTCPYKDRLETAK
jgi:hypothetical protein